MSILSTEPNQLIVDLKSSSSLPNALLGIGHWDKANNLSGTGISSCFRRGLWHDLW